MKKKLYKENIAILFHHFHDKSIFYKSPGSLKKRSFRNFLKKNRTKITNANDFLLNFKNKNKLVALSFDDGLKCQYKLALPELERLNVKAFFFIPTSNFDKNKVPAEVIRYFKYKCHKNINEFYNFFYKECKKFKYYDNLPNKYNYLINKIGKESPYYNSADIKHKIIRDYVLGDEKYNKIILSMMGKLNLISLKKKLLMSKKDIKKLDSLGHVIGLHSHSHFYQFHNLKYAEELNEYKKNKNFLEKICNHKINVASFPFGYKNINTDKVMKKLNVEYAFLKNFKKKNNKNGNYNIPRENISNIIN